MIVKSTLVPAPFWAFTAWPLIVVRPEHANDPGIIVHEMVHYREQAWITPVWWILYWFSTKFRVAAEVRAYKAQIAARDVSLEVAAHWLLKYDADMTYSQAVTLLS